ncbi:MAG: DUF2970 domain-containing protein [Gammaproteobacteria bacterium]
MNKPDPGPEKEPGILQIIQSLLASFFGVQSQQNMDRDEKYIEKHGIKIYIILGFSLVVCLVLGLIGLVKLILHFAT